ncbi:unnamed protein product [Strongylus vulgaris]|uniref:Uncharacterized protein n=1 Tax=Strongylus vulgaris TaxID=40348 RepID=A0A3P7JN39_STRVU|nr:unnamed protein product [Strongylus vulgaris]
MVHQVHLELPVQLVQRERLEHLVRMDNPAQLERLALQVLEIHQYLDSLEGLDPTDLRVHLVKMEKMDLTTE